MDLKQTLTLHALKLKALASQGASSNVIEALVQENPEPLRQICARISPVLYDEVSNLSNLLDIPQRQFVEMALVHAVAQAHSTLEENGVMDLLEAKG